VPAPADAVRLWDAVTTLAEFPGFAEMKRSLREVPQLPLFGWSTRPPRRTGRAATVAVTCPATADR
jgi:hypothetical protein